MHLALLTNTISPGAGGLYHCVRLLALSLYQFNGTRIDIFAIDDQNGQKSMTEWAPLRPHLFSAIGPSAFNYSPSLNRYLKSYSCDLFHVHGLWQYVGVVTAQKATESRRPYVITPQGMLDPWALKNSRWKKVLGAIIYENRNLRNASCIHAVCQSEYKSVRAYGLGNPVCIIPNGVQYPNLIKHNPALISLRRMLGKRKMLLFLSRIHPKKGLENLIKAWASILKTMPNAKDWVLGIAGWDQGGHENELVNIANELGIPMAKLSDQQGEKHDNSRLFLGWDKTDNHASLLFLGPAFEDKKDALLRYASAFILPSYSEGMPVAVLEAWAYGKPVIMTPACNLPEGFAAGAAIKIEPEAESIAEGIRQIMEMSEYELVSIGEKGRRLVKERFTWPEIARQMKSVYDWLLGGGSPPNCVILD